MLKDNAFIYWFLILMPPVLGLSIFLLQGSRLKRVKDQYNQLLVRFLSSERIIEAYEENRLRQGKISGTHFISGSLPDAALMALLEKAETMVFLIDFLGKVLFINDFSRKRIGVFTDSDEFLYFTDFCSKRLQALVLSEFRKQQSGSSSRVLEVHFTNRFNEDYLFSLQLLTDFPGRQVLVLATEKEKGSGFGALRYGRILEAMLYRSRWPSVLLEKPERYGGWRNGRIIWLSASAGRLLSIEPLKAAGLPLELISPGLAQRLPEHDFFSAPARIWHKSQEEHFQVEITNDGGNILLILKRVEIEIPLTETEHNLLAENSEEEAGLISFSGLLAITGNDEDFIRMLLPSYLNALRECRADFRVFTENMDAVRLRFLHHKIKATIRTFGLHQLDHIFEKAIELLEKADHFDREELNKFIADINTSSQQTEQAIQDFARERNLLL
jgi:hypothetical protein